MVSYCRPEHDVSRPLTPSFLLNSGVQWSSEEGIFRRRRSRLLEMGQGVVQGRAVAPISRINSIRMLNSEVPIVDGPFCREVGLCRACGSSGSYTCLVIHPHAFDSDLMAQDISWQPDNQTCWFLDSKNAGRRRQISARAHIGGSGNP